MKTIKILSILCAVLLTVFAFSSCQSTETADDTTAAVTEAATTAEVTTEAETTAAATEETAAETTAAETEEEKISYDRSEEMGAVALSSGDVLTGGTYSATETDQSAVELSSGEASLTGALIEKLSGDASSADSSSFEGVNAGVRVYGNGTLTLKDCDITADAENATGVFAYDGGVVYIEDCTVNVTGGGAGGVQVAGGGTLYGTNLTVNSASKAAIRSDRGGGILVIDGGTYTSTGSNGCPAIYSTADITVSNAECTSTNSRGVIIEGKNSVTLNNVTLTGNDQSTKEGSVKANILLYQSASGDADEGTSVFSATDCRLVSNSGAMFYCTNTASVINVKSTELVLSSDGTLLIVSEGRWGSDGSNGGDCEFNAEDQTLEGDIIVDEISSLELNLVNSTFTGSVTGDGDVEVTLDSGSTWTLTADSYISSFSGDLDSVDCGNYTLYINGTAAK